MRRFGSVILAACFSACAAPLDSPADLETRYWPNDNKHSRGQVIQGLREGHWMFWYQYGQKKEEGSFARDRKRGEWRLWHPSGVLLSVSHYDAGVRHGPFESWYRDGTLHEAGQFSGGERDGLWIEWLPNQKGRLEVRYERGLELSRRTLPPVAAPEKAP